MEGKGAFESKFMYLNLIGPLHIPNEYSTSINTKCARKSFWTSFFAYKILLLVFCGDIFEFSSIFISNYTVTTFLPQKSAMYPF